MDLGCIDLGCIDKTQSETTSQNSGTKEDDVSEKVNYGSKTGKNKSSPRGSVTSLNALNKCASQIKKPTHRKTSPLNWFPRKKIDSYLKRKIKMLQEVDGMNLTLDETLGDSNPHYTRVLREKIAAREAARTAMDARKAALVEGSWLRILRAARIQCKEAETQLIQAEKAAAEAFEAATAKGVIMYDKPSCPQKTNLVEIDRGGSSAHNVTASFETAFEVDKKVAAAVKSAFMRLASCPSLDRDEFKDLLRKISETPDTGDTNKDDPEFSSGCESESGSELEKLSTQEIDCKLPPILETRQRKSKRRQSMDKFNMENLVTMMLERLKNLKDEELSSLATIVATCGLNAALAKVENTSIDDPTLIALGTNNQNIKSSRRISSVGGLDGHIRKKQQANADPDLPSLDKFLVKHMTRLEREVLEARNKRKNESTNGNEDSNDISDRRKDSSCNSESSVPDLGSILVKKHLSKFEREIKEARKNSSKEFEYNTKKISASTKDDTTDLESILIKHSSKLEKEAQERRANAVTSDKSRGELTNHRKEDAPQIPGLDKVLVKHVSRLEREVQEARKRSKNTPIEESKTTESPVNPSPLAAEKENLDLNKKTKIENNETVESLDSILVKPVHKLEKEKELASSLASKYEPIKRRPKDSAAPESGLDKVLVKHVSKLEKEKMSYNSKDNDESKVKKHGRNMHAQAHEEGGLDQVLVKHKSRLEKERENLVHTQQNEEDKGQQRFMSRREARERELQQAWGGLSLGNSIKPHVSKLERDKAAWIKAEEEERRRALAETGEI